MTGLGDPNQIGAARPIALLVTILSLFAPALAGANAGDDLRLEVATGEAGDGSLGAAAQASIEQGYLVPDPEAHARQKARANAAAAAAGGSAAPQQDGFSVLAPTLTTRSWQGIFDTTSAPSDSTGAVGNSRYVEMVNRKYAIYNKSSDTPIATGTLNEIFGQASTTNSFDPQVIWDPGTKRFYYAGDSVRSSTDNVLSYGFSTDASPDNGTTDWCHYEVGYGSVLPDYPKLGDTRHFAVIGVNKFGPGYLGSDLIGIGKPSAGTTCPSPASFAFGVGSNIQAPGGGAAFTPVPANQTDTANVGWVVARTPTLPSTTLSLHRVSRGPTGSPVFQTTGRRVAVPNYTVPADAQQRTPSVKRLDTLDARPTQAVSAIHPATVNGAPGTIWTQHTTNGGAGAEIRWYEIDPGTRTVVQSGKVTSPTVYNFNGAVSPDRAVNGATVSGGNRMVLGYTASGTGLLPTVRMVSKVGAGAQSAPVLVQRSSDNYVGFDCAGTDNDCRWGDYASATPDPTPPAGQTRVWMTNTYASGGTSTAQANWLTWNWAARP